MLRSTVKILISLLLAVQAQAEITLDSKDASYDQIHGIVTATGDVVVIQTLEDGSVRELHTEKIEYHKNSNEIRLIGRSSVKEPGGETIIADSAKLDPEFKNALVDTLTIILKDSSKVRALSGTKTNDVFTLKNATYTPCKETNCSLPLWDLAADKATYDKGKKKFVYKNVRLRIKGVPVFFSPYFEHPSSEVGRKTGFLTPMFRNINDVGFFAGFPFYVAIDEARELTLEPFLNSEKRAMGSCSYKQKFYYGDFNIAASALAKSKKSKATTSDRDTRWHLDAVYKSFNLDHKRFLVRINRSSDVTYKSVYPVDLAHYSGIYLTNTYNDSVASADFYNRNYFIATDAHIYQTNDKKTAPTVFPHININCRKDALFNGTAFFDSDTIYLNRDKQKSTKFAKEFFRSSNKLNWERGFDINPFLLEINSGLRVDIFNVGETPGAPRAKNDLYPILENQASLSLPFISKFESLKQTSIWGPKVTFTSIETSKDRANFEQNEDSIFDNFSDINIHAINRYGGYDAIENGERVSIGIENSMYNSKRRWLNAFVGRSHNIGDRQHKKFAGRNSTVGRVVLKPIENLSIRMRFVGMPYIEKCQMFESGINGSYKRISAGVGYLYDTKISHVQENGVSQFGVTCGFKLTDYWSISASKIFNLKKLNGERSLTEGISALYKDECLELGLGMFKTSFKNGDIKPRSGFILTLILKNLGNVIKASDSYAYSASIGTVE